MSTNACIYIYLYIYIYAGSGFRHPTSKCKKKKRKKKSPSLAHLLITKPHAQGPLHELPYRKKEKHYSF